MSAPEESNVLPQDDQTESVLTPEQLDEVTGGNDQGFNVITWDPRGEFASGGSLGDA